MVLVSNTAELIAALDAATAGTTIELAPGNYGNVVLDGYQFEGAVTIRSQDPDQPATFDTLLVKNSSHLTFDSIAVSHELADGEPDWSFAFRIDKSDHISVINSEISGTADGNHTNDGQGLSVLDSSNILLEGNTFHDLKTGVSVGRSEYVEVRDNSFTDIRSDGIDVANVRHVVVDGNVFSSFHPAFELGDHPDMIQVWNDGSYGDMFDIVISNNTLSKGDGDDVQAIFVQGAIADADGNLPTSAYDIVIDGNVIDSGAAQGIWVSHVDDARISNNTLTVADDAGSIPTIRTEYTSNTIVEHNSAPQIDDIDSIGLIYTDNVITADVASGATIFGTAGADILEGSVGNDVIFAAASADIAHGGDGNDTLHGEAGDDSLYGGEGSDGLNGGAGNDLIDGGAGNDGAFGGGGNDRMFGGNGDDILFGDGGNDMLNGGAGADQLHGGSGNDGFFGGGGNDLIYGDAGNDVVFGDGGNDTIDGGSGDDILRGGAGADVFILGVASGSDQIMDFADGMDRLDFSGLATVNSIDDLDIVPVSSTNVAVHYFDGISTVELELISAAPISLDASDFLF